MGTAGGKIKGRISLWRFLKGLNTESPYDPEMEFLGIYTKEPKATASTDTCTPVFITALFLVARSWKQPKCPSRNEWISKM